MAGPLGKLTAVLGLDAREFSSGMDSAKKDLGGFGVNSQTAFKVAGAAAAVGFGLMTKGALEMESAQGKFQAATGASREEAIAFSKDMNGLVGTSHTVGMSFEDIAAAGTMVSQQFGLTGEDAKELTDDILGFAKVTGQDATAAAGALEDLLSSFGLEASDAAGFMDKLVASNQKFGTDAGPEALDILNKMAPALTTMGMGLDDGVELLNAFEVAGLDAGAAQKGLQKAIGELKPGENLDDLITQIGAIEDPTLRAQKAIEIFGSEAGVGLAKVIKPGMTSLDEFGISADEAEGKVDKAADDMLTTTQKFQMFAEKVGGLFREGGQMFGPLVSGLAGLSTLLGTGLSKQLGDALSGGLDKVKSTGAWKAAAEGLGKAVGLAQAGAHAAAAAGSEFLTMLSGKFTGLRGGLEGIGKMGGGWVGAAMGAGVVVGLAAAAPAIQDALRPIALGLNKAIFGDPAELEAQGGKLGGTVVDSVIDGIHTAVNALGDQVIFNPTTGDWFYNASDKAAFEAAGKDAGETAGGGAVQGIDGSRDEISGALIEAASGAAEDAGGAWERTLEEKTAIGLHSWAGQMQTGAGEAIHGFTRTLEERTAIGLGIWAEQVREHGKQAGHELAMGLNQSLPDVHSQWEQFKTDMKNTLDPMKELAWLEGKLSGKRLAKALEDENPLVRARAETMRDSIVTEISDLKKLLGIEGEEGGKAVGDGIDTPANKTNATNAGSDLAMAARRGIDGQPWSSWGSGAAGEWVSGFVNGISHKQDFIERKFEKLFEPNSPPAVAPNIDRYGEKTGELWGLSVLKGGMNALSSGFNSTFSPAFAPSFAPSFATPSVAPSSGGLVVNGGINVTVAGGVTNDETGSAVKQGILDALGEYIGNAQSASTIRFRTA